MTTVTVYTKPAEAGYCGQCVATKRKLTNLGIDFTEANIYADESLEMLRRAEREGVGSVPVVHVETDELDYIFGGFQPPKLQEILLHIAEEQDAAEADEPAALEQL